MLSVRSDTGIEIKNQPTENNRQICPNKFNGLFE